MERMDRNKMIEINDYYIETWKGRNIRCVIKGEYDLARKCGLWVAHHESVREKLENDKRYANS